MEQSDDDQYRYVIRNYLDSLWDSIRSYLGDDLDGFSGERITPDDGIERAALLCALFRQIKANEQARQA